MSAEDSKPLVSRNLALRVAIHLINSIAESVRQNQRPLTAWCKRDHDVPNWHSCHYIRKALVTWYCLDANRKCAFLYAAESTQAALLDRITQRVRELDVTMCLAWRASSHGRSTGSTSERAISLRQRSGAARHCLVSLCERGEVVLAGSTELSGATRRDPRKREG